MITKFILITIAIAVIIVFSTKLTSNQDKKSTNSKDKKMNNSYKINKTEEEWKKLLTPEQYNILREKGTERPYTGEYNVFNKNGKYKCAACGNVLFTSETKFDSHCGWPSFYDALDKSRVKEIPDYSYGMNRIEVVCADCGGHLGHVFEDGPKPTGLRYCINSVSIRFEDDTTKSK